MSPKIRKNTKIIKNQDEKVNPLNFFNNFIIRSGTSLNNKHTDRMGTFFSPSKL